MNKDPQVLRRIRLGGLPIAASTMDEAAHLLVEGGKQHPRGGRPVYVTSANGQVIAFCNKDPAIMALFLQADIIHADGQPMVWASRLTCKRGLPERVATSDLFYEAAALAEQQDASFYVLGAPGDVNERAVMRLMALYPKLRIVGQHHGYFSPEQEATIVADINKASPDILWVSLGVPLEQNFVCRNLDQLTQVGLIKTSGGVLDFVSGDKMRAPRWMQNIGLEWLFRAILEPRRLAPRYLKTNFQSAWALLFKSGDL